MLCSKLRRFSYEEIEFFLPQLCYLLISIDNESMALEEFIVDLCEESVNGALLVHSSGAKWACNGLQQAYCVWLMRWLDFLAFPDLPPRPLRRTELKRFSDLSKTVQ